MVKHYLPPFVNKVCSRLPQTTQEQRKGALEKAGYNVINLPSSMISGGDYLTDSGNGALLDTQRSAMELHDETYAGSSSFERFETAFRETTGMNIMLPVHQGRAAEKILCKAFVTENSIIPSNSLFDTTRAHIQMSQAEGIDLVNPEFYDITTETSFKGNINPQALRELIGKVQQEAEKHIPFCILTLTNNKFGGQPVSMENIRQTKEILDQFKIPLVFDACRFSENAYFIKKHEPGFENRSIASITLEMFSYADMFTMSAKKDGLTHMGGVIGIREEKYATPLRSHVVLNEGYLTYGGLSGRDLEAIAVGIKEVNNEVFLEERIGTVRFFGELLKEKGLPVLWPPGGSAIYIDAAKVLPHLDIEQFPGVALVNELYLRGGIRAYEMGSFMYGSFDDQGKLIKPYAMETVRFCIPRLVYSRDHLRYVADILQEIKESADQVPGMSLITRTQDMPYVFSKFAPSTTKDQDARINQDKLIMTEDYGNITKTHVSVNDELFRLFEPHLTQLKGAEHVGIGDYGCADGQNSHNNIRRILSYLYNRYNVEKAKVNYTDLMPENGVYAREFLTKNPDSFLNFFPKTDWTFVPGSFYHQLFPESSIDLGFSVNAMHWQPKVTAAEYDEDRFKETARQELLTFLGHRSKELRPGGVFIMANSTFGEEGMIHPTLNLMKEVLNDMLADGIISQKEKDDFYFPMYMRGTKEFDAPFSEAKDGWYQGMKLISSYSRTFPCQYNAQYQKSEKTQKDKEIFANGLTKSRRAWSYSTVFKTFSENEEKAEEFYRRYNKKLLHADPTQQQSDFTIHFGIMKKITDDEKHRTCPANQCEVKAWSQLPENLQAQYPAPSIAVDSIEIHDQESKVTMRIIDGHHIDPKVMLEHIDAFALHSGSQACLAVGHLMNDVFVKSEETFLRSINQHNEEASLEAIENWLNGDPIVATIKTELVRGRVSSSNPNLVRKMYSFDFKFGRVVKGTMQLHFSLPIKHEDPLNPPAVHRLFTEEEVQSVLSPYLISNGAIGKDTLEMVDVSYNPAHIEAIMRLPTYYTSDTDYGGFHLSAIKSDVIVHKIAHLHARVGLQGKPVKRAEIKMTFDAPLRDPDNIPVHLSLSHQSPNRAHWNYTLGDNRNSHGSITFVLDDE